MSAPIGSLYNAGGDLRLTIAQSSACVANPATWPLLTPIWNPDVCPSRGERWELRGNELGCRVSTTTFLSVVVSVFSTLGLLLLGWLITVAWVWSSRRWKSWYTWWRDLPAKARAGLRDWWQMSWKGKFSWTKTRSKGHSELANEDTRLLD